MSLVLGLDIGASAIKAVLMEDVLQGEVIRKFYHYPYGNQTREEALEYFFESVVLEDYDRLVVSLKGYEGSVRIVELPFNEIKKVRSVLPYELENEFADGSHERSFRFHSIPNRAENIHVNHRFLSIGVYDSVVNEYSSLLKQLNKSAYVMDYDAYANFNCHTFKNKGTLDGDDGVWLLVDIGARSTGINIINRNKLLYTRSVFFGGNDFTKAIAQNLNLSFSDAEELKLEYGLQDFDAQSDHSEIDQSLLSCLDKIVQEIKLTLGSYYSYQGQHSVEGLILYGGGSNLKGLSDYIQQMLGFPVLFSDPLARIKVSESAPIANNLYSIAIGLALRGIGEGQLRENFLPQRKVMDSYFQKRLMMHSVAIMLLGFLYFLSSGTEYLAIYLKQNKLKQNYEQETRQILASQNNKSAYKTVGALHRKITERKRLLEKFSSSAKSPLDILNFLAVGGSKELDVQFSSIVLENKGNQSLMKITGTVPGVKELRQFESILDQLPGSKKRELVKSNTAVGGNRLEFEQAIKL